MGTLLAIALLVLGSAAPLGRCHAHEPKAGAEADPITDVLGGAKPTIDVRARYGYAAQDGRSSSDAATIRLRLGLETPEVKGVTFFAEFEHTEAADRNSYQAASVHGLGENKTVIADPESSELNRLWISLSGLDSKVKLGRQRIVLDDARFIGNVGWRQNEQTYYAVRILSKRLSRLTLNYAYLWNVQRIFGSEGVAAPGQDDFDSRSHLVNLAYEELAHATIKAYAYLLDLENREGNDASNNSLGISIAGQVPVTDALSLGYHAEYARQTDSASSALDYRADFVRAELSGTLHGKITLGLGYQMLGGGDGVGFQTPLATLHKWQGFADVFLATPSEGLIDRYAWATFPLPLGLNLRATYHDFTPEDSRGDFGHEYDLLLSRKFTDQIRATAKYANYDSETRGDPRELGQDIERFTFQLEYQY